MTRSAQHAPASQIPLFALYPELEPVLARVPLCQLPTPVERAEKMEQEAGTGPLYIKRDDCSAPEYGGNKPRKLEWLLGRAQERGASRVMTFGGLATNHGFATTLYATRLGLDCELILVDQPASAAVRRRLRLHQAAGARLFYGRNVAGTAFVALTRLVRHPRTFIIPVGGTSPRAMLGLVNAGLELGQQIEAGALPEPARVYLACGSGGTAAGLALGLALAGLHTRVVAVLITDILAPSQSSLQRMARRTLKLLRRSAGAVATPALEDRIELETGFIGPGYGHATREAEAAQHTLERLEDLILDGTYTGKAFAALLARERGRNEPILFWHSYSAHEPELALPDWRRLPRSFHRFFPRPE